MKAVALLGGSRFIGYHLVCALQRAGHRVTVFNRGITSPPEPFYDKVETIQGDRNRPDDLGRLFRKSFDVVYDLSGYSPCHLEPIIKNYRSHIGHFIFCSTTAVYKPPLCCPLREDSPRIFIKNTYGGDKALVEDSLMSVHRETHWPVTIFRPQFVFGPYDAGSPTRQLKLILGRMSQSLPIPVKAWNSAMFNLLFVDDLVRGFVATMENTVSHGKIYNVAGDTVTSGLDVVEMTGKVGGHKPDLRFVNNQGYDDLLPVDPWPEFDWIADNSKIKKELGLAFTDLTLALSKTHDWFRSTPAFPRKTSFRGERYLLNNRPVPGVVRICWRCADGLKKFLIFLSRISRVGWFLLVYRTKAD